MKKTLLAIMCLAAMGVANAAPVMKITLLGTGVPLLNAEKLNANGRAMSGLLVQAGTERMLFDCGQGIVNRLLELQEPVATPGPFDVNVLNPNIGVNRVFLSHLHSDHIADLAPLYIIGALYRHPDATDVLGINNDLTQYAFPTKDPLKVWGPSSSANQPVGTWAMMQSFRTAYQSDIHVRALWSGWDASVGYGSVDTINNTTELSEGVVYSSNGVTVTAFPVNHAPVTPSYGFRVDYQGHSFVYSGDTAPTPKMVKYARGVDVLVHEVYGYPRDAAPNIYDYHTSPEDAATLFNKTKPKQVVYTHLVLEPGTTPDDLVARTKAGDATRAGYKGKIAAGVDFTTISINEDNTVTVGMPTTAKAQNARKATSHAFEVARDDAHTH